MTDDAGPGETVRASESPSGTRRTVLLVLAGATGAVAGCTGVGSPAMARSLFAELSFADGILTVELKYAPDLGGTEPETFSIEGPGPRRYSWPYDGAPAYEVTAEDVGAAWVAGEYTLVARARREAGEVSDTVIFELVAEGTPADDGGAGGDGTEAATAAEDGTDAATAAEDGTAAPGGYRIRILDVRLER